MRHAPPHALDTLQAVSQFVAIGLLGLIYGLRAMRIAVERRPAPLWRMLAFYAGLGTLVAALITLERHAPVSLSWNTLQLFLIGEVATLLMVLGLTAALVAPLLRWRALEPLRALTHPLVAFPLWALNLYLWHLPALAESALHSEVVLVVQHLCFLVLGINMWMCLLGPLPVPRWFGDSGKLAYVVVVRATGIVLANILLWSDTVFYPYYVHPNLVRNVSPLADQNMAGAIMLVGGSVLTVGLFAWLFVRSLRVVGEPDDLVGIAEANGWARTDERGGGRGFAAGRRSEPLKTFQPSPETFAAQQQPPS